MAPDTSSGAADRAASGETGRPDDPWRRVETEQAERDRIGRAYDATHDPGEAFEKHHQDLPEQYRRPGKYTVNDFSTEQRAELEEMTGQKLEDILAKRDQAFTEQQAQVAEAEPGPSLAPYPEFAEKHTANTLVRAYEDGEISYQGTIRRLELLGFEPRIREPEQSEPGRADQPDQPEQPEQAERSEQAGDPRAPLGTCKRLPTHQSSPTAARRVSLGTPQAATTVTTARTDRANWLHRTGRKTLSGWSASSPTTYAAES